MSDQYFCTMTYACCVSVWFRANINWKTNMYSTYLTVAPNSPFNSCRLGYKVRVGVEDTRVISPVLHVAARVTTRPKTGENTGNAAVDDDNLTILEGGHSEDRNSGVRENHRAHRC